MNYFLANNKTKQMFELGSGDWGILSPNDFATKKSFMSFVNSHFTSEVSHFENYVWSKLEGFIGDDMTIIDIERVPEYFRNGYGMEDSAYSFDYFLAEIE